jgi:hypothetical protein
MELSRRKLLHLAAGTVSVFGHNSRLGASS